MRNLKTLAKSLGKTALPFAKSLGKTAAHGAVQAVAVNLALTATFSVIGFLFKGKSVSVVKGNG
jgi:hypothetical protein